MAPGLAIVMSIPFPGRLRSDSSAGNRLLVFRRQHIYLPDGDEVARRSAGKRYQIQLASIQRSQNHDRDGQHPVFDETDKGGLYVARH